jgi:hypothetical protein
MLPARRLLIKYTYSKYDILYKNQRNLNQWTSGCTGLLQWYSPWIESQLVQRIMLKASSPPNHVVVWKYITGTDRRSVRGQTVLSLPRPFNTGYRVKYHIFARILAVCRARAITNPTMHSASFYCNEAEWIVGIVIARAQHTARIRAKSLNVSEKTIIITAHICSETTVFDQKCTFRQA